MIKQTRRVATGANLSASTVDGIAGLNFKRTETRAGKSGGLLRHLIFAARKFVAANPRANRRFSFSSNML
jgi:hypothetical protein